MKGPAVVVSSLTALLTSHPTVVGMGHGRDRTRWAPPVVACYGVRLATNWLAGSVASVLVNIVRNRAPAGANPT
jgi:hypothetical protein